MRSFGASGVAESAVIRTNTANRRHVLCSHQRIPWYRQLHDLTDRLAGRDCWLPEVVARQSLSSGFHPSLCFITLGDYLARLAGLAGIRRINSHKKTIFHSSSLRWNHETDSLRTYQGEYREICKLLYNLNLKKFKLFKIKQYSVDSVVSCSF